MVEERFDIGSDFCNEVVLTEEQIDLVQKIIRQELEERSFANEDAD